jgi:nicotinate-nucleotide pyrophosphorylase
MGTKLPEFQLPEGYSVWSGGGDWWFECLAHGTRVRSLMFNNREAAAVQAWKHHADGLKTAARDLLAEFGGATPDYLQARAAALEALL